MELRTKLKEKSGGELCMSGSEFSVLIKMVTSHCSKEETERKLTPPKVKQIIGGITRT
jgi:hypothetical protein